MRENLIAFKGVNEGVFINIKGVNMKAIKEEIDNKIKKSLSFYKGSKIIGIKSDSLSLENMLEIKFMLKYKYDLSISDNFDLEKNIKEIAEDSEEEVKEEIIEDIFSGIDCGMTKFITGTIRSGQVEDYPGNIVIIGDVNPGGLIQAKGNIIVLGTLKGLAHAGIGGNSKAVIAAYKLEATQIRIADKIVRSPDQDVESYKTPEIAKIKENKVIIEPYLPNK